MVSDICSFVSNAFFFSVLFCQVKRRATGLFGHITTVLSSRTNKESICDKGELETILQLSLTNVFLNCFF